MKILHYCQHVLGLGHVMRSLEIAKALSAHDVVMVTGGPEVNLPVPSHVRMARLPGLMMDEEFNRLSPVDPQASLDRVKQDRQTQLMNLFVDEAPELFLVELYPFGRKAFAFEIDPILEGLRIGRLSPCRVACSLRDILVEKKDPASYTARVLRYLNEYFQALLVHADPAVLRLDETFPGAVDIRIPLVYTGFVTSKPSANSRAAVRRRLHIGAEDRLIIASAGGGKVGFLLLQAVVDAFERLKIDGTRYLHVLTGPYMDDDEYRRLERRQNRYVTVRRFADDFTSHLAAADLSVSLAGYNTCMNILAAGTPALVWPFAQNREQRLRAEALAGLGAMQILDDDSLRPDVLAHTMAKTLTKPHPRTVGPDLDGAENTAHWLERWAFGGSVL